MFTDRKQEKGLDNRTYCQHPYHRLSEGTAKKNTNDQLNTYLRQNL